MDFSLLMGKIGMFFSAFALFLLVDAVGVKQQARWKLSAMKGCLILSLVLAPTLLIVRHAYGELIFREAIDVSKGVRTVLTIESAFQEGFSQITETILGTPALEEPALHTAQSQVRVNLPNQADLFSGAFMALWVGGTAALLLFHGTCFMVYFFRRREAVSLPQELEELCPYPVFVEESLCSPVVLSFFGVCFPKILVPQKDYPLEDFRFILTHEVTHIKKKDLFWKNMAFFVKTFHWYNPFAYYMVGRFETILELSCDEVIATPLDFEGRKAYGLSVLSVMIEGKNPPKGSGTPMALGFVKNKKSLEKRLAFMVSCDGTRGYSKLLYGGFCLLLLTGGAYTTYESLDQYYQLRITSSFAGSQEDFYFGTAPGFSSPSEWVTELYVPQFDVVFMEQMEIKSKSVAPTYVDLFMDIQGSELIMTYAGFYTDLYGNIVDYHKEFRHDYGSNIVFMDTSNFAPYTLSPTVDMVYPHGLPTISFTETEAKEQEFRRVFLEKFPHLAACSLHMKEDAPLCDMVLFSKLGTSSMDYQEEIVALALDFYPDLTFTYILDFALDRPSQIIYQAQETPTS